LAVLAGALLALGTVGGKDSLSAPYATLSVVVESAAFVILGTASRVVLRRGTSAG
jgi:hypothetical protein